MRTLPTTSLLLLAAVGAACSGSGSGNGSAALRLSATASPAPAPTAPPVVPLATGELQLASALFHVGNLEIEIHRIRDSGPNSNPGPGGGSPMGSENEGGEGEHQGEHGEEGENEEEGDDEDDDEVEVRLPGPFTFDLAAPPTVITEVPVVPGTFDRVKMTFVVTSDEPFLDASIFVSGTFVDGTTSTPFTLRSDFHGRITVPVANGGITATANSVVPVELTFDLTSLFGKLDFASATVADGEITIDSTHNVALLFFFEAGLGGCAHANERDD